MDKKEMDKNTNVISSIGTDIFLSHNGKRVSVTGTSPSDTGYSSICSSLYSLMKPPEHKQCRMATTVDANPTLSEESLPAQHEETDDPESLPTMEAWMPVDRDSDEYNMNHPRRGNAVIFNNEEFDLPISKRRGSSIDVERLKELFTYFGFDVTIHHNKCSYEIKDIIDNLAEKDHSDADCVAVTVLSHGKDTRYIYARDDIYSVESLWTPFTADKCPTLAGKPKIFFIQACQGERSDPGVNLSRKRQTETELSSESHRIPTNFTSVEGADTGAEQSRKRRQQEMKVCSEAYKIPTHADFLVVFSSVEVCGAYTWNRSRVPVSNCTLAMIILSLGVANPL